MGSRQKEDTGVRWHLCLQGAQHLVPEKQLTHNGQGALACSQGLFLPNLLKNHEVFCQGQEESRDWLGCVWKGSTMDMNEDLGPLGTPAQGLAAI